MKEEVILKDEPLYRDAIFAPDQVSDYQVHHHTYSPDAAAFETICHQTFSMLSSVKSDFQSQVSSELFRVFVAELLWLRWGQVLRGQGDHIPEVMREALDRASQAPITVPEPIHLWLMSFGEIVASTGERIRMSPTPKKSIGVKILYLIDTYNKESMVPTDKIIRGGKKICVRKSVTMID